MRIRWTHLALLLALVAPAGYFGKQFYDAQQQAALQLSNWKDEQAFQQKLGKIITIKLGTTVPIRTWLDEWTRQSGLPVELEPKTGVETEFDRRQPVFCDVSGVSAHEALQSLCELNGVSWSCANERIEIHLEDPNFYRPGLLSSAGLEVVSYPLPPRFTEDQTARLLDLLHAFDSDTWDVLGGQGSIQVLPGRLIIAQERSRQQRIAAVLAGLQSALNRDPPQAGMSPSDPRLRPIPLERNPELWTKLLKQLEQPVSFDVVDLPLAKFAEQIELQTGVKTVVNWLDLETEGNEPEHINVTCQVRDMQLRNALTLVLDRQRLTFAIQPGGQGLQIVPKNQSDPDQLICLAYPADDLMQGPFTSQLPPLGDLIVIMVESDSWSVVGGPGQLQWLENCLVIETSLQAHWQIQDLLAALRQVRSGLTSGSVVCGFTSQASRQLLEGYEQQAELKYDNRPLNEIAADLRARCGIPVYCDIDARVSCHLPARCLRENLAAMLAVGNLQVTEHPEYLAVLSGWSKEAEHVTEIFDTRYLLTKTTWGEGSIWLDVLITKAVDPQSWANEGGRGSIYIYDNLLFVRNSPDNLRQVRRLLAFLQAEAITGEPRMPEGLLTREELNSPLQLVVENHPLQRELEAKLLVKDSVDFRSRPLREALLKLARKHNLPLAGVPPTGYGIPADAPITVAATDEPLSEILALLIDKPKYLSWQAGNGFLRAQPWNEHQREPAHELFYVGDLLQPRGKWTGNELLRRILRLDGEVSNLVKIHANRLVSFHGTHLRAHEVTERLQKIRDEAANEQIRKPEL